MNLPLIEIKSTLCRQIAALVSMLPNYGVSCIEEIVRTGVLYWRYRMSTLYLGVVLASNSIGTPTL